MEQKAARARLAPRSGHENPGQISRSIYPADGQTALITGVQKPTQKESESDTNPMRGTVDDFLQYLRMERGQSDNTVRTYAALLGKFVDWAHDRSLAGWQKVGFKDLTDFLAHERERPLANRASPANRENANRLSSESVYLQIAALRA